MSAEHRGQARFFTKLDLLLYDARGQALDVHATAQDISPAGFRAETRGDVTAGQIVKFELLLEDGGRVRGSAKVVWQTPDGRGWSSIGAKITKISWHDRGRLRNYVTEPGYDFVGVARALFWTAYWVVVAVGIHNVLNHQALTRELIWKLAPVAVALLCAGWAMLQLVG